MKPPTDAQISNVMRALALRRTAEQRKGKPPKPTTCPRCGALSPTARQARGHKCEETR